MVPNAWWADGTKHFSSLANNKRWLSLKDKRCFDVYSEKITSNIDTAKTTLRTLELLKWLWRIVTLLIHLR
jgi:hypothetical protein